jgi:hypothetical protein
MSFAVSLRSRVVRRDRSACDRWTTLILRDQPDIMRYHECMSDVLIRDLPDDVLAGIDARAAELGLSRVEYIRRRLAQDARAPRVPVTREDLDRFGAVVVGLTDEDLMREAWR